MNTTFIYPEIFNVYRGKTDAEPNLLGETVNPDFNSSDLELIGQVRARVNTGDSLEPDVRGVPKDYGIDTTSMWLAWYDVPDGFDLENGDIIVNPSDTERAFQIQFLDKYPGGKVNHHYESRLQTTEIFRKAST